MSRATCTTRTSISTQRRTFQQLNLDLVGSALTEAFTAKWGKLHFDEKLSGGHRLEQRKRLLCLRQQLGKNTGLQKALFFCIDDRYLPE